MGILVGDKAIVLRLCDMGMESSNIWVSWTDGVFTVRESSWNLTAYGYNTVFFLWG